MILVLVGGSGLAAVSPAQAAKSAGLPTLASVNLSGVPVYSNVRCSTSGVSSFDYTVAGTSTGSYAGTFTESGHVTIDQQTYHYEGGGFFEPEWYMGLATTIEASFAVTSPTGVVTGTRTLTSGALSACQDSFAFLLLGDRLHAPALMRTASGLLSYQATVTSGRRVYCDRGTSITDLGEVVLGPPADYVIRANEYSTAFSSDLAAPAPRRGHKDC